ncbi:MAG: tRNA pseudouridine(38-40) synthase TruA [Methanoculleaceae archaeon]
MRIAFRLGYIGDNFAGSQIQPDLRTVEGEFIGACRRAGLFGDWREARLLFAGRTDRGVHARWQVAAFDTDRPDLAVRVLNRLLPPDLWCSGWAEVDHRFHPRHDAVSRTYRYYFSGRGLDTGVMARAARSFEGLHDFTRFSRPQDRSPVRTVYEARVDQDGSMWYLEVTADGFLWNMVRRMTYMLMEIGRGREDEEAVRRYLQEEGDGVPAAPPTGLVLWYIRYDPPVDFIPLDRSGKSLRYLERLREEAKVREKVAALLNR